MSKDEVPVVQLRKKKPAKKTAGKTADADEGEPVVPLRRKKAAIEAPAEVPAEGEPVVSLRRKKTVTEAPVEDDTPVVAMGRKKKAKTAEVQAGYGAQASVMQNYAGYDAQAYGAQANAQANYAYDAYGNPIPVQKKSKAWLVITLIIAGVILVAAGVVILLLVINNKDSKGSESSQTVTTSGVEWGDKFASYLANMSDAVGKSVLFYESKLLDDPAMLLFKKGKEYIELELYGIKSGKVEKVGQYSYYGADYDLRFMYDVEKENYTYFVSSVLDDDEMAVDYKSLDSYIIEQEAENKLNDAEPDLDKIEEEAKKNENYAAYTQENSELDSGNPVYVIDTGKKVEGVEFKSEEQLLKEIADKYATEIIKNSELGKEYDEEIQQKVETVKKAQENAGIKVGNYTVKYGKYKMCAWLDEDCTYTIELKPNGEATQDGEKMYWRVGKHNFAQGVEDSKSGRYNFDAIAISKTKDGVGSWFTPYMAAGGADLSDGDMWYLQKIADEKTSSTGGSKSSNSGECASWLTCVGDHSFMIGSYTVQFGDYEVKDPGGNVFEEFTLNKDGTAVYDGEKVYFRVEDHDFSQDSSGARSGKNRYQALVFSKDKGGQAMTAFTPYLGGDDCDMGSGPFCVEFDE